eukprot:TRINITY_DN52140_c0_g1_i1.p1 TRINITY_DN52140_c0_g1~~TRINITY_DN52140_c0_g1_i1.p1  ORF type:complete len:246 (-),score=13.40 TRINITY_DN52140_c0_g1_i1:192-881(-)
MAARESEEGVMPTSGGASGAEVTAQDYEVLRSHDLEEDVGLWQVKWLGRIAVIHLPSGIIYVGPHWYCCLLMLSFILGVGWFFTSSAQNISEVIGGVTVTMLSTLTFIRCAISNPGVVRPKAEGALLTVPGRQNTASPPGHERHCRVCNIVQPTGCSHCEFCEVCIDGFDHHCPWMGKCIGSGNLCKFYLFIAVGFSSLAYVMWVSLAQSSAAGSAGELHGQGPATIVG